VDDKHLTIKELKEYLRTFDENENFSVVVINPKKRIVHKSKNKFLLSDTPAMFIETEESEPFEENDIRGE
jgi:hypothetical protein